MLLGSLLMAVAGLSLGFPFKDGVVLQAERPVPVWGQAPSGKVVRVDFAGQSKTAVAGADGRWRVVLDPMGASGEGRRLYATSQSPACICVVSDVLVGEVWLCSGQSNMEMSLADGRPRYGDGIGAMVAQVTDKPKVRYFTSESSADRWHRLTAEFLTSDWRSSIPVHYALELHDKLGVPVGVIVAACGGSTIERWNPLEGEGADLHKYRIAPLDAFAIRGALWYQGESNIGAPESYVGKLRQLHEAWQRQFAQPSLPLYLVQLAPYGYAEPRELAALPVLMENQARYAANREDAEVVIVNDIGNMHDIHPNEKWLVARRLALHALKRDYGFRNVEDCSPVPFSAEVVATNRVRIVFDHAKNLYVYRKDSFASVYAEFELAGEDGVWKRANIVNFPKLDWTRHGVLTNNVVELEADLAVRPVKVRHAYVPPFAGCLYNQVNLPCGPFCMDVR